MNINPFKIAMCIRQTARYLFFVVIALWLLSSCEQKELCYNHSHASNIHVAFSWDNHPEANPTSMLFYLYPKDEEERVLKREFIGKDGGTAQALVGISYDALCFNSDTRNTMFRNASKRETFEAYTKDAGTIDKIGLPSSTLPRAEGTEQQRMAMEADSLWSDGSLSSLMVTLEQNDNNEDINVVLYPKQRFCTYRVKILSIDNLDKIASSIAASLSGLAGGIRLLTGEKNDETVTVPFAVSLTTDSTLEGKLRCYGNTTAEGASNKLVIYTVLRDGTKWCYIYDVTNQVKEAQDPYNVEIVLDNLPVPTEIGGNSGFTPGVSDWNIIEIPIKM